MLADRAVAMDLIYIYMSMAVAVSTDHAQNLLQCSALIIILTHMAD